MVRETRHTRNADDSRLRSTASRRTVLRGTLAGALAIGTPALAGRAAAHGNDEVNEGGDGHRNDEGGDGENHADNGDDSDDGEDDFASVVFENQTSDGTSAVVESVTMPDGGFISIHDERFVADDDTVAVGPGSIVGYSEYLAPGTHSNVVVELFDDSALDTSSYEDDSIDERVQTLIALPHRDTNDNEEWDFYPGEAEADGAYKQGPQSDDDVPLERIMDTAKITVPTNEDDEQGEEADGREDDGSDDGDGHSHDHSDDDDHDQDGDESHDHGDDHADDGSHSHDGDDAGYQESDDHHHGS